MTIRLLTVEEHQRVVERLIRLASGVNSARYHSAGPEYTSLMVCFLLHNISSAETLLRLRKSYDKEWFPSTVGYVIARTMFEIDVNAHYITLSPKERSRQYIEFEHILKKKSMDVCQKHRNSSDAQWREAMSFTWKHLWDPQQADIEAKYLSVRSSFELITKKGKSIPFQNWAGKSIRQMAIEVHHEEAYDIFYAELSSFAHADVILANSFLKIQPDGLSWSRRSGEGEVGNVFRHAAIFLTCFLELFAEEFKVWSKEDVQACWNIGRVLSKGL